VNLEIQANGSHLSVSRSFFFVNVFLSFEERKRFKYKQMDVISALGL